MINDPTLAPLFQPFNGGSGAVSIIGGILQTWNPTTYENTVKVGATQFTNAGVLYPSLLSTGNVVLLMTAAGPIILGRIYKA